MSRTKWLAAVGGCLALLAGACSDDGLPSGPVLSLEDCGELQSRFDATSDASPGVLSGLDEQMRDGGCYATDEDRAEMLDRDGDFGELP